MEEKLENADKAVTFRGVTKRFGPVVANEEVSFNIRVGSFHALLGENGAGKTTLMRILAGELTADDGEVFVCGRRVDFRSPREARALGIRLVHQHSVLIPNLSIAENFILDSTEKRHFPNLKALCDKIRSRAAEFGIPVDPEKAVWELSATQRQWLEVFRALFGGARIVILDEPTAMLSPVEGDALLVRLKELTEEGISIILITHKMREVFKFADMVTVLRGGRWVATEPVDSVTESSLAAMMVDDVDALNDQHRPLLDSSTTSPSEKLVEARGLSCSDHRDRQVLRLVDFRLSRGEILGVAGVSGNGQAELARIVAGVQKVYSGALDLSRNGGLIRRYIPDDRIQVGTAANLSVRDNLTLRDFRTAPCSRSGWLDMQAVDSLAASRIRDYQIATPSSRVPVRQLSGGNIQRVVVARELAGEPDLVVAHNPTAGLDVATAAFVRHRLAEVAARGGGVLLISDDLDELLGLANRMLVLHQGAIAACLEQTGLDRVVIAGLMAGVKKSDVVPDRANP